MSNSRPAVIICEMGLRWTAAWRRCDKPAKSRVETVNSLMACEERLRVAPASFVIVETSGSNMPALLDWLTLRLMEQHEAAVAIIGDRSLDFLRYGLMERGARLVATSERQLPALCAAARRHLSHWQPQELTLRERVLETLPWSDTSP